MVVEAPDNKQEFKTLGQGLDDLIKNAKRGQSIQRYKGLGEMNPGQLWETTLDPKTRALVRVMIEDDHETERTFDKLMGDEVPPRRAFIEENALSVSNLDI